MSKLPPLPRFNDMESAVLAKAYGAACRAAALEECAQRFERVGAMSAVLAKAYGAACRAAALEECAQRFERVGAMIDPRTIADAIRALKDA